MSKIVKTKNYDIFVKIIKMARLKSEMTQVELAKKLKVQQSFISKYENNERKLDVLEFIKICQIISIRPTDIIREFLNETAGDI